jgi:hypothetical protein
MVTDGEYTAVVDRFENDHDLAVLLLERDGETVDDVAVPRTELPENARHQDAILRVRIEHGEVGQASYESEETAERKERAQARLDRLSQRPPESNSAGDSDSER